MSNLSEQPAFGAPFLSTSPHLAAYLCFILSVSCLSLSGCCPAGAEEANNAVENYRAQVNAAALDDKCTILKPDERAVLNAFREGLAAFIGQKDTRFKSSKKPSLDMESRLAAQVAECDKAATPVRDVYEDTVATKLSMEPALLTIAMSQGERCKVISQDDNSTLMRAWVKHMADVAKKYSASIKLKYLLHVNAAEQPAAKVTCSEARQNISAALKLAREILRQ
jgi:hypothetical protein